jgi:hypothetical protein
LETGLDNPWWPCAVGIYTKWLHYLGGRKSEQRPLTRPVRRAWRDWPASAVAPAES